MTATNRFTSSTAMQKLRAHEDVEYHIAGAMVGHRLPGGEADEVDTDMARRIGAGEITTEGLLHG